MEKSKFISQLEESNNKLWGAHFVVPPEIAKKYITKESKRVVCTLNNTVTFQCGIQYGKKNTTVITVNTKIRKQLCIAPGDTIKVTLEKDDSEYGLPITEELKHAMLLDEETSNLFKDLTPGTQRTLLYIAGNIKNSNGRIIRALVILEHLKLNNGKVNFRQLNEAIKQRSKIG